MSTNNNPFAVAQFKDGSGGGDFEIAEGGVYVCRLIEVEVTEKANFNDPTQMDPAFCWKFETTKEFDSKDRPYRFIKFTGVNYGNDKANLTLLLDGMLGKRLTRSEAAQLFTPEGIDELKEQSWKVMVDESTSQSGKVFNKIVSVRSAAKRGVTIDAPMKPTPKPARVVEDDDDDDPFVK